MIDDFCLVKWKRLDYVCKMSQKYVLFWTQNNDIGQRFSKSVKKRLVYSSCETSLQRVALVNDWPF